MTAHEADIAVKEALATMGDSLEGESNDDP